MTDPPQSPIRILLADDHAMVRAGLRLLLDRTEGLQVVGEAEDGRAAIDGAQRLRPDVVLMDLTMPGLNGYDATAAIVRREPGVRVLVVSMHEQPEAVARAFRAGASGYVIKGSNGQKLVEAVRIVAGGGRYVSPELGGAEAFAGGGSAELERYERLTPRQREVFQLVAEGHTTKGIAERLGIAVKTVEAHRAEIMRRLQIGDLAGLVRYAVRVGVVGA